MLVAKDNIVLLERGYGVADRTEGVPCTARTRYDVGSVAKILTVALVEDLARRGLVRLSDPITRYFEDVPADKSTITVAQLVAHTSGLPRAVDLGSRERRIRASAVAATLAVPLESRPGERERYSNAGYQLLAAIVEIASGLDFESALRELVAGSGLSATRLYGERPEPGMEARGYAGRRDLGRVCDRELSWTIKGAGGVASTVGDVGKWIARLRASDPDFCRRTIRGSGCVLGWNVNGDYLVARGAAHGFRTECRWYADGTVVIVACNCEIAVRNVVEGIADMVRGLRSELPEPSVAPTAPPAAAGSYESTGGARFVVRSERDALVLVPMDGAAVALLVGATPTPARGTAGAIEAIRAAHGPTTFLGAKEILPGVAKIWAQAGARIAEVVLRHETTVDVVWKPLDDFELRCVPDASGAYVSLDLATWEKRSLRAEAERMVLSTADGAVFCTRTE